MPLNFSQLLGGAAFSSLNAILGHNASRDGYSKPNRYEVMIYLPAGVTNGSAQGAGESATNVRGLKSSEAARRVSFRCDSIAIPGRNLRPQVNGNIYGPPHEIVQGITFGELQATFYLGNDLGERYFFEEWQKTELNWWADRQLKIVALMTCIQLGMFGFMLLSFFILSLEF